MTNPPPPPLDWRGIPILPGAYVIYSVEAGRGNGQVEGQVRPAREGPLLTPDGNRVWVRVVRRAVGGGVVGAREYVHVSPTRISVLGAPLPASTYPTEPALAQAEREKIARRKANESSHRIERSKMVGSFKRICKDCTAINTELALISCDQQAERDAIANGDAVNARDFADKIIADKALKAAFSNDQLAAMGL